MICPGDIITFNPTKKKRWIFSSPGEGQHLGGQTTVIDTSMPVMVLGVVRYGTFGSDRLLILSSGGGLGWAWSSWFVGGWITT